MRSGRAPVRYSRLKPPRRPPHGGDTIRPSAPGTPNLSVINQTQIDVSWSASTDTGGSGLKGYDVQRNGATVATNLVTTSFSDTGLTAGTSYSYQIIARDNALNDSLPSNSASASTPPNQGNSTGAQADWIKRSTGPGVVKAYDFRSQAEVTNFLYHTTDGTFTNLNVWRNDDGITGGCYEAVVPAGDVHHGGWVLPFSPLVAGGNGLSTDDPACAGTLTKRTWTPGASQLGNWADGYYQHPLYQTTATHPQPDRAATVTGGVNGYRCDNVPGHDFWIQFRVKMPASRFAAGQPDGKLVMVLITGDGPVIGTHQPRTPNQELVVKSNPSALYQMYTNFGRRSNSFLTSVQGSSGTGQYQPGADYSATCVIGNTTTNTCWSFPADEWVTVLIHLVPGRDGGGGDEPVIAGNPANDTTVEVWVARANDWEYTKIWEKKDYVWSYGGGDPWPFGFNAFALNAFMNDVPATQSFYHRYTQVILSRQYIPCPQPLSATVPTFASALSNGVWAHIGNTPGKRFSDVVPASRPVDYNTGGKFTGWTSGCVDQQSGSLILPAGGGHLTDGSGNDVFRWEARNNSPGWQLVTNPTIAVDGNDIEFSGPGSAYSDGKIRAYHGWQVVEQAARKVWVFGPEGTYSNGRRQTEAWTYDFRSLNPANFPYSSSAAPWTRRGDPLPTKGGNIETQGGPSDFDEVTWKMFRVANQGENANSQSLWSMHASTYAAQQYNVRLGSVGNGHANWMRIADDKRVAVIGMSEGYIVIFNPDSPTTTWAQKTPTGTGVYGTGTGCVYHRRSGKIICWDDTGNTLYALNIPSNPFTGTYSWSSFTGSGVSIPAGPPAGMFGKFNLVEDIGNGQGLILMAQRESEGVYCMLLPFEGI